MTSLLSRLPDVVMEVVCTQWLKVKDLGMLDTACSSSNDRPLLLKCLRNPGLNLSAVPPRPPLTIMYPHHRSESFLEFLKWARLRECETTNFPEVDLHDITAIRLDDIYPRVTSLILCGLLVPMEIQEVAISRALQSFPCLTKLELSKINGLGFQALTAAPAQMHLESLIIVSSSRTTSEILLSILAAHRDTLRFFGYPHPMDMAVYEYIMTNCLKMTCVTFDVERHTTKESFLNLITSSCERLENIVFHEPPFIIKDAELKLLPSHLPNLQEFCYAPETIHDAHVLSAVIPFFKNCPNLKLINAAGVKWRRLGAGSNTVFRHHSFQVGPSGGSEVTFDAEDTNFASRAEVEEFFQLIPPVYGLIIKRIHHNALSVLLPQITLQYSTTLNYMCFYGRGILVACRVLDLMKTCANVKLAALSNMPNSAYSILDGNSFREFTKFLVEVLCEVGQSIQTLYFYHFYQLTNVDVKHLLEAMPDLKSIHFSHLRTPLLATTRTSFSKRKVALVEEIDRNIFI